MVDTYAIPTYRGFQLTISENFRDLSYYCNAYKYPYYIDTLDDHGKLHRNLHEAESVEFTVDRNEIYESEGTEIEIICRRFKAEVDYYLKHKQADAIPVSNITNTRRFVCTHCGTELTTDKPGYTPTCCNCGALMILAS